VVIVVLDWAHGGRVHEKGPALASCTAPVLHRRLSSILGALAWCWGGAAVAWWLRVKVAEVWVCGVCRVAQSLQYGAYIQSYNTASSRCERHANL
jgi:hypothetical protein